MGSETGESSSLVLGVAGKIEEGNEAVGVANNLKEAAGTLLPI